MTYRETLYELLNATHEMDIFALIGYDDAKVTMGFRVSYWGEPYNDPIIGDMHFMIAGDAYDTRTWERIATTKELNDTPIEFICIQPRAVGYDPYSEIHLGKYEVKSMKVEAFTDVLFLSGYQTFPERIRFHIKRKEG